METQDINAVALALGLSAEEENFYADKQLLIEKVNELIVTDFEKLVGILYRLDVNENKIKGFLDQHTNKDAAEIIVNLMLERELEKRKSRRQYSRRDNDIDENEKW